MIQIFYIFSLNLRKLRYNHVFKKNRLIFQNLSYFSYLFQYNSISQFNFGVQRRLVAHLVWDQRVEGSNPFTPTILVSLAQSVEHQIVVLRVVGSIPTIHPTIQRSQLNWIEQQTSDLQVEGSIPFGRTTFIFALIAQLDRATPF